MECGIACCTAQHTAIATLTIHPTLSQTTTKHPKTLLKFQIVAICHQYTIHHWNLQLVLLNAPKLPGTSQKPEIGITPTLKSTDIEESIFSSGSAASGLLHLPSSCNGHMSTTLLDSSASHKFIALLQL